MCGHADDNTARNAAAPIADAVSADLTKSLPEESWIAKLG
jgi:hypothetical protein